MDEFKELLKAKIPTDWLFSNLPIAASDQAISLDALFNFLIISASGLFLVVVVPMFWFSFKYRRTSIHQKALSQKDHNTALEIFWSVIPFIYLGVLFVWGFNLFLGLYIAPDNAKELRVVGQKWQWIVQYPKEELNISGKGAVIGVLLDEPVKLTMVSQDVIHSFYIPNFRVKQDVLPGRYSALWFTPNQVGEFPVLCAEYCGDQHSVMQATIKVMPKAEYDDWILKIKNADSDLPPVDFGKQLYVKKGCNACHTTDGRIQIGPSFKGIYGATQELAQGGSIKVDDNFIRSHILDPQKNNIKGFAPVMPSFRGQINEKEIGALIEFIKSLK